MFKKEKIFNYFYFAFLSEKARAKSEKVIVTIAIVSFALHLLLIALVNFNILHFGNSSYLLNNPIASIYTPFSFILLYEVYLLVYYLPKSTSIYIGKQYEIITLIVIRRVFKDLSKLEFTPDWFTVKNDLQFSYDLIATLLLFFLILIFYRLNTRNATNLKSVPQLPASMLKFIKMKNIIALCLIPLFIILAVYSLFNWMYKSFYLINTAVDAISDINKIFFNDFFTVLILIDVLLLLFSFLHTNKFSHVIRNSGFIISTILIKLSFATEGILNTILIVVAVLFGVIILSIHNQYEKLNV
jgi:hypothetical protein